LYLPYLVTSRDNANGLSRIKPVYRRLMQFYIMAQAVRDRPLTTGPYVQFQARPCGICNGKICTLLRFSLPLSVSFHQTSKFAFH